MMKREFISRLAPKLWLLLKVFMAVICLIPIIMFGIMIVTSQHVPPEESVRLTRASLLNSLAPGEKEKIRYAICRYHPATPKIPENWVSCEIDIKGSDEIIYMEATLNGSGRIEYSTNERWKR